MAPLPTPEPMVLTERDLSVLRDLYLTRFLSTQGMFIAAAAATDRPPSELGIAQFAKRLTAGGKAGLWLALKPGTTYLKGAQYRIYTTESGKARIVGEVREDALKMEEQTWTEVLKAAEPWRVQTTNVLVSQGLGADEVKATLERTSDTAMRWMAGRASHVNHYLLAGKLLVQLWYGLRTQGIEVGASFPDKAADLSFDIGKKTITITPDHVFTVGDAAVILEAETGTAGRAKVADKVTRYLALHEHVGPKGIGDMLGVPVKSARVVFYCQTAAHELLVQDEIRKSGASRMFLTARVHDWHLGDERGCEQWTKDHWRENRPTTDGRRLYQRIADRAFEPLFSLVTPAGADPVALFAR